MRHLTLLLCAMALCMGVKAQEEENRPQTLPMKKIVPQERRQDDEARRQAIEAASENIKEGAEAPDFTLKDINGNDLSLSSLRGKYVLLDFWGSWCIWCVKGMPMMKEYYAKYDGKFEILGIDCRDSEEKWMQAVSELELPWLHVYNPAEGTLTTTYAIKGFPTKILIDPNGVIVRVVLGEEEDFYPYLDEVFSSL